MKKIAIALFTFFAVQIAAAQKTTETANPKVVAASEIEALSKAVPMDDNLKSSYATLFVLRAQEIASTTDEAKKKEIFDMYAQKLWWGLNEEQRAKLEANKDLYNKIMVYKK
ncbi:MULTISPECIES: hypothetical protein [Flavobacterium]|jgi:hypothetical protein|uniref:Uncharacterized protein n=1 Tax=Flavobacterium stagni TaxID=2506421 RepID=A0A4Q1K8H9_9FLAO|nr:MULTISPECIES: hypothetical protein [Flavobacterium]RXR22128.1 hypothetical protein EQG61_08990 [Flavobacterium stagni]